LSDGTVIEWGATYGNLTPRRPPASRRRSRAWQCGGAVIRSHHDLVRSAAVVQAGRTTL